MKRNLAFFLIVLFTGFNLPAQNRVDPMMTTNWNTFNWPLNAAFPECSPDTYGAVNGHLGNSCGPTAVAKFLHFNRHPVRGEGTYSCTDEFGISHSFDFENSFYKWNLMKDEFSSNATPDEYMPTAEMVYHAYGMMEDPQNTGRSLEDVCNMLKKHMRYSSSAYVAYRFDYSDEEFTELLKSELDEGRSILIESWTSTSNPPGTGGNHAGHYWNIDGYDEQDRFHMMLNNDSYEGWCRIEDMIHARDNFDAYYIWALINAIPDESAKLFSFTTPSDSFMFRMDETINLSWEQHNINNINIDISYYGAEWITIGENISTAGGSWAWDGPDQYSKDVAIRVRDVDNEYYEFIFDGYESYEEKKLNLVTPVSGDNYESGTGLCLAWKYEGIPEIVLEYRESTTGEWTDLGGPFSARERFNGWTFPSGAGKSYDFRISSPDQSYVETIVGVNTVNETQVGGPYKLDYNTNLLMHFDKNLDEEIYNADALLDGPGPVFDYSAPGKGAAIRFDNSDRANQNGIIIPHEDFLSFRGSFTIDLWFKIYSWDIINTNKPLIIAKPAIGTRFNYALYGQASSATIAFKCRTTAGDVVVESKQGIIVPDVWYHVAMIHDAGNMEMKLLIHNTAKERIDEQSTTYQEGVSLMTGVSDLVLGKKVTGASFLDGSIDELRISRTVRNFNAVWSGNEVEEIMRDIRIYPNPVNDNLRIEIPEGLRVTGCVLRDMNGRTLRGGPVCPPVMEIKVEDLPAGIYLLTLEGDGFKEVRKVLVK